MKVQRGLAESVNKPSDYWMFAGALLLALTFAIVTIEASGGHGLDLRYLFSMIGVHGIALFLRSHIYDDEVTFFDFDHRNFIDNEEQLIVFGLPVPDLAKETKERRVLTSLEGFAGKPMLLLTSFVGCLAAAVYINTRINSLDFADLLLHGVILAGIFFAPFLQQLLVPLFFVSLVTVFLASRTNSTVALFGAAGFLVCLMAAFSVVRNMAATRAQAENFQNPRSVFKTALALGFLFLVLHFVVDFALPKENPFKSRGTMNPGKMIPKPSPSTTEHLSKKLAEEVVKWREQKPEGPSPGQGRGDNHDGKPTDNPSVDAKGTDQGTDHGTESPGDHETKDGRGGDLEQLRKAGRGLPRGGGGGGQEPSLDQGKGQVPTPRTQSGDGKRNGAPDSMQEPSKPGGGPSDVDQDRDPKNRAGGEDPDRVLNQLAKQTPGTEIPSDRPKGSNRGNDPSKEGSEKTPHSGNETPGEGSANNSQTQEKEGTGRAKPDQKNIEAQKRAKDEKQAEIEKKIKLSLDIGKGLLVFAGLAAGLWLLFKLVKSSKKQDPTIHQQQLSLEEKRKLQGLIRNIKARNLSPDAEVIELYNALLTVFEKGHFARADFLPAEDFSVSVGKEIPLVAEPFEGATGRFSQTLYGKKPVGPTELDRFRSHVSSVLKFFDLQ